MEQTSEKWSYLNACVISGNAFYVDTRKTENRSDIFMYDTGVFDPVVDSSWGTK